MWFSVITKITDGLIHETTHTLYCSNPELTRKGVLTIIGFFEQTVCGKDGTTYEVNGICGWWFEYAGDYKRKWQWNFIGIEKVMSTLHQIARGEVLDSKVQQRIFLLCGVQKLSSHDSDHHFWIAPTVKSIGE